MGSDTICAMNEQSGISVFTTLDYFWHLCCGLKGNSEIGVIGGDYNTTISGIRSGPHAPQYFNMLISPLHVFLKQIETIIFVFRRVR